MPYTSDIPETPNVDKAPYDILGTVVQRSFGKQSGLSASHYLNFAVLDAKTVRAKFVTLFTSDSRIPIHEQLKGLRDEALDLVKESAKRLGKEYKEEIASREKHRTDIADATKTTNALSVDAKKSVSFKVDNSSLQEQVEYVQTTLYSHTKKAHYKLQVTLEVV